MGIAHGAFCVGCCWRLMLVMFGVGLGSLTAMLVLGGADRRREEPAVGPAPDPAARGRARPRRRVRGRRVSRGSYARRDGGSDRRDAPDARGAARSGDGRHARRDPRGGPRSACSPTATPTSRPARVAEAAEVPLSQIHYHFGSKHQLILAVLAAENERLLERQRAMFDTPEPLWVRWELACDFLDDRRRVGLRPDPPGDDRRRLVRRGGRGCGPRDASAAGTGSSPRSRGARQEQGADLGGFTPDEVAALMGDAVPRRRGADPARRHRGRRCRSDRRCGRSGRSCGTSRSAGSDQPREANDDDRAWPGRADAVDETVRPERRRGHPACILDYFEGWFDGDAARMDRALHPGLAKHASARTPRAPGTLDMTTKDEMVEATSAGGGRQRDVPDRAIRIDDRRRLGRHRERGRPLGRLRRVRAPGPDRATAGGSPARCGAGRMAMVRAPEEASAATDRRRLAIGAPPAARTGARPLSGHHGFVERDGVRVVLRGLRLGRADRSCSLPTWSIVHSRFWKMQIPYFARRHRVITFDARGNGRSDRPADRGRAYGRARVRRRRARGHGRDGDRARRRSWPVDGRAAGRCCSPSEHPERVAGPSSSGRRSPSHPPIPGRASGPLHGPPRHRRGLEQVQRATSGGATSAASSSSSSASASPSRTRRSRSRTRGLGPRDGSRDADPDATRSGDR